MKNFLIFAFPLFLFNIKCGESTHSKLNVSKTSYSGSASITRGLATPIHEGLLTCPQEGSRISAVGKIKAKDNTDWIVPAASLFETAPKVSDLYNECNGVIFNNIAEVDEASIPIVEVDRDGEVVTGYLFGDNYFELYINGQLIGVDPVPFTPFNSNIARFRVKRPYTIALKLVDWEENLGLGSESMRGSKYHAGDGGFIASFSDGTLTNDQWKAQTFYIAPIKDLTCLREDGSRRLSNQCDSEDAEDGSNFYAAHWKIPDNWQSPLFDDSAWPQATTYTEEVIGVDNKKSYTNFREKFGGSGAKFIWSTNVVLDNVVIVRYEVGKQN